MIQKLIFCIGSCFRALRSLTLGELASARLKNSKDGFSNDKQQRIIGIQIESFNDSLLEANLSEARKVKTSI